MTARDVAKANFFICYRPVLKQYGNELCHKYADLRKCYLYFNLLCAANTSLVNNKDMI